MAKTGSIEITYKQDVANNKTTITVKGVIKTTGESYRGDHRTGTYTIKVGSTTLKNGSFTSGAPANSTTTLFTYTTTVSHNADGTYGTVTASYNYDSGWCTASGSKTIPNIARQSSFGTISGDTLGSNITVNITRYNSSFTHSMWYSFGNKTWQHIGGDIGTQKTFQPPLSLCGEIPNASSGTMTLILRTYNGSTQIGVDVTKTITVKVPTSVVPSFTGISHSEAVSDVANAYGVYTQGKTKLKVNVEGAAGVYGSTIKTYLIEVDGQKVSANTGTTGVISSSGNLNIKATITDTRGRTATKTQDIYVYPYATPYFNNIDIVREDTAVVVKANGGCSSIMVNNVQKNEFKYRLAFKEKNGYSWTDTGTVATGVIGYAIQARIEGLSPNVSYDVKLYAADKITESGAYDLAVSTAITYLDKDVKNGRLAIGKMLEYDDSFLEVPEGKKAYFGEYYKQLDNLLEYITNGNSHYVFKYKDNNILVPVHDDTGWVDIALKDGYTPYTDAHPLQVRRIGKIVHMRNVVTNDNAVTFDGSQVIANLPEQFRPSKDERSVQQGSGSNRFIITVYTFGDIRLDRYSNNTDYRNETGANSWLNMYMTWFVD